MAGIYLIINVLLLGMAAWMGWRSRRLGRKGVIACAVAGAALMVLRNFLHEHPEYEQYLLNLTPDYVYFAAWEAPVVILFSFGLAVRLQSARLRRLVVASLALLAPVFLWNNLAVCVQPDYDTPARFDESGICRQATDYSCGPAAAVTVLRLHGEDVSEGEMSRLCLRQLAKGVTPLELCRGLNIALRSRPERAAIQRPGADGLGALRLPFLAEMERPFSRRHCVVVLEIGPDSVVLGDPARGRFACTREQFLREWTGLAITVGES